MSSGVSLIRSSSNPRYCPRDFDLSVARADGGPEARARYSFKGVPAVIPGGAAAETPVDPDAPVAAETLPGVVTR